jgi:hypothetical protein
MLRNWKRLALVIPALTLAFSTAHAGGINLSWNDCGAFGVAEKNFACTTNVSVSALVVSAIAPVPMPQLMSAYTVIELATDQPSR